MSIASLSANFSTSLSISRVNAVTPVRPRIAQERTEQSKLEVSKLERSRPERSRPEPARPEPANTESTSPERTSPERTSPERLPANPTSSVQAPRPADAPTTAERTRLRSRQSEEGSLTLTTDEGDTVTISFRNQQSTRVDQTKLYGPNGSFESTKTRSRESSQLSVSLDGQLSEAELKDITDLVNRLSAGIDTARNGGDTSTSQQEIASTPEDLGTLQSYNFAYQQSSQLSYKSTLISVTA